MLEKMITKALYAHLGQVDKGGQPYILHPLKVMFLLDSIDEELNCIAVGHDLFEDTNATETELRQIGMSNRVIAGIEVMTKKKGQSYEEYKEAIKANRDAVKVKMCDLRHNSDISRLKDPYTRKNQDRIEKYREFYMELNALRNENYF